MTDYVWKFSPLKVTYSSASLSNVVTSVHWQYHGTHEGTSSLGVSGSFRGERGGVAYLQPATGSSYTNYDDLTHAQVLGWVTASLGEQTVADITSSVSGAIAIALNPTIGVKDGPTS